MTWKLALFFLCVLRQFKITPLIMDMSLRWKCIYLITCFRQGFPGLKFTLPSVTQLHAELRAVPGNSLSLQQANPGKGALSHWFSCSAKETRGPRVQREHHGATTSLWVVHWEPPAGAWGGHKAPERASPGEQQPLPEASEQGAVPEPPVLEERAPATAAEEAFCAARTAPAIKRLSCVSG